jgi:hypothetical protein
VRPPPRSGYRQSDLNRWPTAYEAVALTWLSYADITWLPEFSSGAEHAGYNGTGGGIRTPDFFLVKEALCR